MTNIAKYIDHTLLRPDAKLDDISKLVEEANEYDFHSVCVGSCWESVIRPSLKEDIKLCVVKNFPHGNAMQVSGEGSKADEIDYVANIGYVKSGMWTRLRSDFDSMKHGEGASKIVKVIVEVGYLTDEELFKVSDMLIECDIDFIKTCTGYGPRGVTVEDIAKIKKHVGDRIKIKASGKISTLAFARELILAGADRIGCSSSVSIMNEQKSNIVDVV